MQATITLTELGLFILFLTVLAACAYAVITLRHINAAVRDISDLVHRHRGDLDTLFASIPNVAETSENAVDISRELKTRVHEAGKAIQTISRDTTDTVLRVNETADQVATYALVFGEIAKAVLELFSKAKRR
jgi:methyl-accepting chemotaxis protein